MKTNIFFALVLIGCFMTTACKEKQEPVVVEPVAEVDLIQDTFPQAEKELRQTMEDIMQSVKDGDVDKLIAYHAYGPKFTEFKNGEPRNGDAANEQFERNTFGAVTEVLNMGMDDLKIAVYGDVANVTFHSDFQLKFGDDLAVVNEQISLLFVKDDTGQWKIVHEHHSPLTVEEG